MHATNHPATDPTELPRAYDPAAVEERIAALWERGGWFRPRGEGPPFAMVMPPPNLTGELHMGHALTVAIQDLLVRWHRMRGDDALWLPGVDHAALGVNALVERQLAEEGLSRQQLGRERFLERIRVFVDASRSRIAAQHRRLGASADWERERFTLDAGLQRAVRATFARLFEDGLVYRGAYIVNWCPECRSAVSDLEVEHHEQAGCLWHVRYPAADGSGEALVVATTRPETIPADAAVAVHPEDGRHRRWLGRRLRVPGSARAIPVIADAAVDPAMGSGALKVTPGHDPTDFEIGRRHGLAARSILEPDGTLSPATGDLAGLDCTEARRRMVAALERAGLIERVEPHRHAVGRCERSGTVIEPLVSEQWFVRAEPLAAPVLAAVRDGRVRFVPGRFQRVFLHWMEGLRDWCISRQIWWGHRIPAWTCVACGTLVVALDDPARCARCGSAELSQDPDTLDTWFSSGLWPHAPLGWPERTPELARYYPTQVLETGYDILFFWVARMLMLGLYNMDGAVPFQTVYLHGLVRGRDGAKMSKSRGNAVDPISTLERYGCDALRFALVSGATPGADQRVTEQRLEAARNFANKLWNVARFALRSAGGSAAHAPPAGARPLEDRWILSRSARLAGDVGALLGAFEPAEAARRLRGFVWDELADWYLELAKPRVRAGEPEVRAVLLCVLDRTLRLLHPFMPFVTEELWQRLSALLPDPHGARALLVARYPEPELDELDADAEARIAALQDFVRALRNLRSRERVAAGRWVEAWIIGETAYDAARALRPALELLARVRPLHVVERAEDAPLEGVVGETLRIGRVALRADGAPGEAERATRTP